MSELAKLNRKREPYIRLSTDTSPTVKSTDAVELTDSPTNQNSEPFRPSLGKESEVPIGDILRKDNAANVSRVAYFFETQKSPLERTDLEQTYKIEQGKIAEKKLDPLMKAVFKETQVDEPKVKSAALEHPSLNSTKGRLQYVSDQLGVAKKRTEHALAATLFIAASSFAEPIIPSSTQFMNNTIIPAAGAAIENASTATTNAINSIPLFNRQESNPQSEGWKEESCEVGVYQQQPPMLGIVPRGTELLSAIDLHEGDRLRLSEDSIQTITSDGTYICPDGENNTELPKIDVTDTTSLAPHQVKTVFLKRNGKS